MNNIKIKNAVIRRDRPHISGITTQATLYDVYGIF